ncbi:MAG: preprotein translocase subunit SecE [Acidimicrobiia bacterium]|nr:preprotein translocase subunit SecE [Acidimicrobiia bacterium]NNC76059.1 preprotein translocase subunit SecE [Acidimicrobiia bacterium]
MNREMRRIQAKSDERAKRRRQDGGRPKRERVGFRQFLREVRQELRKVAWPTRQQTMTFTVAVVVCTAFVTGFVFGLDFLFKQGVVEVLQRVTG